MLKKLFKIYVILFTGPAMLFAQFTSVTLSGEVKDQTVKTPLAYINIILKNSKDSTFVSGALTSEDGRFTLAGVKPGNYYLELSYIGYVKKWQPVFVGTLSEFLDLATIEMETDSKLLNEVEVTGKQDAIDSKMDKKTVSVADNIAQGGGSVLQVMQNLPGVTVQDGAVLIRGSDKITVLIDGKQTALTGFGSQKSLDNIPASAIDKIEIINNPSSKYDANGNAGIINIIYKKNKQEGFNGKVGFATGLGALWVKRENFSDPDMRPQYQATPKFNPSIALNYRKKKINLFLQMDDLYTQTLNKNEFTTRTYDDSARTVIQQQLKRNRNTNFFNAKAGFDWNIDDYNSFTFSSLYGSEKIIDNGDEPFYNGNFTVRNRLWQFLEDELKTTVMATAAYQHKFKQPGHLLNIGFNYTFHREDERYNFTNIKPNFTGKDAFKLLSDEQVADFNIDYIKPLKYGRIETGVKFRDRVIPTNMQFYPGLYSPIDAKAGGVATYNELIPALYGNYIFESKKVEAEIGLRVEYVRINYVVDPNHDTYKSNGYNYTQPFPNMRLAYKINDNNKISVFYNRRVDRPNEVDIRIFPKYDDAEIIKVGNPALRPQFTNSFELGYKTSFKKGYLYSALYHRIADGTITRIGSIVPDSTIIYNITQNAGRSYNTGIELMYSMDVSKLFTFNINLNGYRNQINAFTVENLYPVMNTYTSTTQNLFSGNVKWNGYFHLPGQFDIQVTAVYLAPDLVPQGKIGQRFSLDLGVKKQIQKGKGEVFLNATDLLNTMVIRRQVQGDGFSYVSADYYETQAVRVGYNYKF